MASSFIKAKMIANRDAAPSVLTDAIVAQGTVFEGWGVEQLPASSDNGSFVKCFSVPSSARISSLDYAVANVGLGTSAIDIGVWFPTAVQTQSGYQVQSAVIAGRLISSSAFKTNIAGVDTGTEWTDGLGAISSNTLPKRNQPLWQQLGLQADPMCQMDLGFSVRTVNSLAGYVGLRARYTR